MNGKHVKPGKHARPSEPSRPGRSTGRWSAWKVALLVVAAIFGVVIVVGAVTGEKDEGSAVESVQTEPEADVTQTDEPQTDETQTAEPEEPAPAETSDDSDVFGGWKVSGSRNVTSLVTGVTVDDAGATIMFGSDGKTRNITGRITSTSIGDTTYPVGDPAVTYTMLDEGGEWLSDLAQWSVGMWGDEPYDGGIRVTVQGLTPDQYSGLTLHMQYDETNPSPWDNENQTISWPDETLTLTLE